MKRFCRSTRDSPVRHLRSDRFPDTTICGKPARFSLGPKLRAGMHDCRLCAHKAGHPDDVRVDAAVCPFCHPPPTTRQVNVPQSLVDAVTSRLPQPLRQRNPITTSRRGVQARWPTPNAP